MTCRIIVADDHPLIRHFVRRIIADREGLEVVAEAEDGETLLQLLGGIVPIPDLVILDVSMPGIGGIEAARRIQREYPGLKVLILTVQRDLRSLRDAMAAGVAGYVLKDDAYDELLPGIEAVRSGGTYLSHHLTIRPESLSA